MDFARPHILQQWSGYTAPLLPSVVDGQTFGAFVERDFWRHVDIRGVEIEGTTFLTGVDLRDWMLDMANRCSRMRPASDQDWEPTPYHPRGAEPICFYAAAVQLSCGCSGHEQRLCWACSEEAAASHFRRRELRVVEFDRDLSRNASPEQVVQHLAELLAFGATRWLRWPELESALAIAHHWELLFWNWFLPGEEAPRSVLTDQEDMPRLQPVDDALAALSAP